MPKGPGVHNNSIGVRSRLSSHLHASFEHVQVLAVNDTYRFYYLIY